LSKGALKVLLPLCAFVLFALLAITNGRSVRNELHQRAEQVAGFELDARGGYGAKRGRRASEDIIGPSGDRVEGYTVPDAIAMERMNACESRGGRRLTVEQARQTYPKLVRRLRSQKDVCVSADDPTGRGYSIQQGNLMWIVLYPPYPFSGKLTVGPAGIVDH
jgi:hypothetical protein